MEVPSKGQKTIVLVGTAWKLQVAESIDSIIVGYRRLGDIRDDTDLRRRRRRLDLHRTAN